MKQQQLHFSPETFGRQTRSLKIAFITDPLASLHAEKDSSIAMMRAAEKRGHEVYAIEANQLFWRRPDTAGSGSVFGEVIYIYTHLDDDIWYREAGRSVLPLTHFDMVIMRKDPPFDQNYICLTWLLERAEAEGVLVLNRPAALRDHSEKLAIAEFPQFVVPSLLSRDISQLNEFITEQQRVVVKPLFDMGGRGVMFVSHVDINRNVILETITDGGKNLVMCQAYIPNIKQGDKRILLIGGQVVPFCLLRQPKSGDLRGNLAAGAKGIVQNLSERDQLIASTIAPILYSRGLLIVGLDVIGDFLTEINVTSPTCMVEIMQQSGFDAANMAILAIENICQ